MRGRRRKVVSPSLLPAPVVRRPVTIESFLLLPGQILPTNGSPATGDLLKDLYQHAEKEWERSTKHYGWTDPRPDDLTAKMQLILSAPSRELAYKLLEKINDSIHLVMLSAWGKKLIPGPITVASLTKKVNQAKSLVKMHQKRGNPEAAQRQEERIVKLEQEIRVLIDQQNAQKNRPPLDIGSTGHHHAGHGRGTEDSPGAAGCRQTKSAVR
jgi:hypothetical protein